MASASMPRLMAHSSTPTNVTLNTSTSTSESLSSTTISSSSVKAYCSPSAHASRSCVNVSVSYTSVHHNSTVLAIGPPIKRT